MLAATASLLGFDARRFLTSEDPFELLVYGALVEKASELRSKLHTSLAVEIANAVGRLFRRGG